MKNFVSYYYQINTVVSTNPKSILEIGVGNKLLSTHLKNGNYIVKNLDLNPNLKPDFVGNVLKMPFKDNSFDTVCAFEILEHLPLKDFKKALLEISRVTKKSVVLSLPIKKNVFFTYFGLLSRNISFFIPIPLIFNSRCKKCKSHFWEINNGVSLKEIKLILEKHFKIKKAFRADINVYHYFFILEKK